MGPVRIPGGSRSGAGQARIPGGASHIEAQILLFLKEIVEDEFAHEVWVQRVIDHLGPSELGRGMEGQRGTCRRAGDSRATPWAGRGLWDSPPATPGWPGSACKAPPLQVGAGREGREVGLHPWPRLHPPLSRAQTPSSPSRSWSRLLGSDLEKVSRSSRFLEKSNRQTEWIILEPARFESALSRALRGGMGPASNHQTSVPHDYPQLGSALSALWTAPEIAVQEPWLCGLDANAPTHCLQGPRKEGSPQNFVLLGPSSYRIPATHPLNPQAEPFFQGGAAQEDPPPPTFSIPPATPLSSVVIFQPISPLPWGSSPCPG